MDYVIRPDFVIVGARQLIEGGRDSAMLIASNRVRSTAIDVQWESDEDEDRFFLRNGIGTRPPFRPIVTLTAKLDHFGQVWAPTYAEAWDRLMKMANPDEERPGTWGDPHTIAQGDMTAILGLPPELLPGT